MTVFTTLFLRIGIAVLAIVAMTATASTLMSRPIDTVARLRSDSGALWTAYPVRVDRASQDYERLELPADPYPFKFSARKGVTILDNATFTLNNETYLLHGVERLDPKGLCRDEDGRLLACGAGGRASLRAALRGNLIECARNEITRSVYIARCRSGGHDLAERLRKSAGTGLLAAR